MKKSRLLGAVRACLEDLSFNKSTTPIGAEKKNNNVKHGFLKLITLTGVLISAPSHALSINVNDNLADGHYIGGGASLNGVFDLNTALSGYSGYNNPYQISSVSLVFSFSDDPGENVWTNFQNYTGSYRTAYFEGVQVKERGIRHDYATEQESSIVTVDGYERSGSSSYSYSADQNRVYDGYFDACGFGYCPYHHYTITSNNYLDYSRDWTTYFYPADASLDALKDTGLLAFNVSASSGDFILNSATLRVTLTENPVVVPVPAAVWLFGSGLLGLVGMARRKKTA